MPAPTTDGFNGYRPIACATGILLHLLAWGMPATADETGETRIVTLRDGSRFRASVPPITLELAETGPSGVELVRTPLSLAGITRIEFSLAPAREKIAEILEAIAALEADTFQEREQASRWLLRNTNGFRSLLNQRKMGAETPPETRLRLHTVLVRLPDESPAANLRPFDRILRGEDEIRDGDLGPWECPATFRGTTLPLARQNVASLSRDDGATVNTVPQTVRQLEGPDDPAFGSEARSISFDVDTEGRPLKVGDDISSRFVGDGVTFSTSAQGSFVSVNVYEVSGPSRGLSAATHDPLYEGMVTIRFSMPGNPGVPAGVESAGLWLAVVKEHGTTLQALDASGEIITEIDTTIAPSQFLGLRSETPIHALRLIPHPDIDPNYTIDDLIFTAQYPTDGLGVKDHPTLSFRNGDRVVCRAFSIEDNEIAFVPASFEAVTLRCPLTEVQAIFAPLALKAKPMSPDDYWVELTDGTRLIVTPGEAHAISRLPGAKLESLPLAALWGATRVPSPPPPDLQWTPESGPLLVDERGARPLPPARLGERWIEPAGAAFPNGISSTYADSPTIWLARPDTAASRKGQVRFPNGERLVLGGSAGFRFKAITTEKITVEWHGGDWTFPFTDTSAVRLPEP